LNENKQNSSQPPRVTEAAKTQVAYGKNPIESVLTALPLLMVIIGVGFYYYNERKQSGGDLYLEQTQHHIGDYVGLSQQGKSVKAQRILWFETADKKQRGARVNYQQAQRLLELQEDKLQKGVAIELWAAPRVAGSAVLWLYRLSVDDEVYDELTPVPHSNTETTDTR